MIRVPIDVQVAPTHATDDAIPLQRALAPEALRTWIALLALWQDSGFAKDGSFSVTGNPAHAVLDLIGANKFDNESVDLVSGHIRLLHKIRVLAVGNYELLSPEALLNTDLARTTNRVVHLRHAHLVARSCLGETRVLP